MNRSKLIVPLVIAGLGVGAVRADTAVFDLSLLCGPFGFTGTLTFDTGTDELTGYQILDGDAALPVTLMNSSAYGQPGGFLFGLYFGSPGANQQTEYLPLSFSTTEALGSAPVIDLSGASFIQSFNVTGDFVCVNGVVSEVYRTLPCGGTLTQETAQAPELDSGSACGALTLLVGCIALLTGRRRRE